MMKIIPIREFVKKYKPVLSFDEKAIFISDSIPTHIDLKYVWAYKKVKGADYIENVFGPKTVGYIQTRIKKPSKTLIQVQFKLF